MSAEKINWRIGTTPTEQTREAHKRFEPAEAQKESTMSDKLIVVTGGGGFIGGSLVASLRQKGYSQIRAIDIKPLEHWYQKFDNVENLSLDLNEKENCQIAAKGAAEI